MNRQVLLLNITRMGDLIQTGPLIARLQEEWPGAAVDLVVDTTFAQMGTMLPGVRHVHAYDFQRLIDDSRTMARDVVNLYRDLEAWAKPLAQARYDRIVNLTFNRRSGFLTRYIGAPDIRGVTVASDGSLLVRNPWLQYFADLHRHRRLNRFNLVDLYALGGSGPGRFAPLALNVDPAAAEWAKTQLRAALKPRASNIEPRTSNVEPSSWIAVQAGASEAIKAWRPEYFGLTMAAISHRAPVAFVLIGTESEAAAVQQVVAAYRAARGSALWYNAVGRTTLPQLGALLAECRLLLTNDTGPMHLAVSVGTSVVNLSVGHVDFRETGPYGCGHWVIQPKLDCAPCDFDQICSHHACKDRLLPEEVAAVCLHALGVGPFPDRVTGARVFVSGVDEDGLGCYRLRAGSEDARFDWYGSFWRRFWYEALTGRRSRAPEPPSAEPPDLGQAVAAFRELRPQLHRLVAHADRVVRLSGLHPIPAAAVKAAQALVAEQRQVAVAAAMTTPAFSPLAVAFLRESQNMDAEGLLDMAQQQAVACRTWSMRVEAAMRALSGGADRPAHEVADAMPMCGAAQRG